MSLSETQQQYIDMILNEKHNRTPYDYLFRNTGESYPKSTHIALELPGIFKNTENTPIFTLNGRSLQQDLLESVMPDHDTLFEEATYDLEHMSYFIDPDKMEVFYQCKNSTIKKHGTPCIIYVITNINYKTKDIIHYINNEAFSIRIIYISQEKIDKILNTISSRDYSKEELSELDMVRLIHCLIFANKKHSKRVVKKVAEIFVGIKKIKHQHHLDLHLALKTMIKYQFQDDIKEQEVLLEMISGVMSDEELEELSTFDYRTKKYEIKIEERDAIIEEAEKTLKEKDRFIEETEKTLKEKDEEIEKLKFQLNELRAK